ncbi:hypothetical protein GO730_09070 [Spirosoma sp. HMF3257]|uniref:Uncharacterized protein n=1 Tax=Spirosoma telluris TaxID=2183553 RepID=A0A327NHT8_9BACT|nr:hypothetical protein [Spirosoma telluris]RAI74393.1 hypothetical protein HMF3257_08980 [Spirosoma telluris]
MKTSYILLAIIALITLMGMVATDVLLKQEYDKIDWRNPYQDFEKRSLPRVNHWVVEGTPANEIMLMHSADKPQALVAPGLVKFFRFRQQGDTAFVSFTPDYSGYQSEPRDEADRELSIRLVLWLPDWQTLRVENARLTLSEFKGNKLTIALRNSRLRTNKLIISDSFDLTASANSFAVLGADQYKSLRTIVQDSSGVQLNNTQTEAFTKALSPKAEIQVRGQALKWLK